MNDTTKPIDRGDTTRRQLLEAAIAEFARDGFHAASNRAIAQRAQVNQALIGYHFGGKEGLYLAVFQFLCEEIRGRVGPVVGLIEAHLSQPVPNGGPTAEDREQAIALVERLVEGMIRLFADPQAKSWAQLILREQQEPTKAFDILYEGFMCRALRVVTGTVRRIRPQDSQEQASIIVASILGQILVFRAARTALLRHLGWDDIGPAQIDAILRQVKANANAILRSKD